MTHKFWLVLENIYTSHLYILLKVTVIVFQVKLSGCGGGPYWPTQGPVGNEEGTQRICQAKNRSLDQIGVKILVFKWVYNVGYVPYSVTLLY